MKSNILPLLLFLSLLIACKQQSQTAISGDEDTIAITKVAFNPDSAFVTLEDQCAFGPRVPNSDAHRNCGDYLTTRFRERGLDVIQQTTELQGWDGKKLKTRNIIASYRPELTDRIIIATHWDSRPWADADPDTANHRKPVLAANDGASGPAVMIEIARHLSELSPAFGIDFILFDTEDYGAPYWAEDEAPTDGSDWCLGSAYWATHSHREGYTARYGILLDMVGGTDARYCYEGVSMRYARDLMVRTWEAAERAGAGNLFIQAEGGYAQDDHVPMNEIAGIPTIDIIPFLQTGQTFGSTWHTVRDTPENISKQTLKGVGQTLIQLISEEKF